MSLHPDAPTATTPELPGLDGSSALVAPASYSSKYSVSDQRAVVAVLDWLSRTGKPQGWLARVARINSGTFSQVLNGIYPASPSKFLAQATEAMRLHDERRSKREVPFVETSMVGLARAACERARTYRFIASLVGRVGTGKTTALLHLATEMPNTYVIEANPGMSAGALMEALIKATGTRRAGRGSTEGRFEALVEALRGTSSLVILDEAETVHPRAMHYLRRLRDKAGIGIVLAGTEHLDNTTSDEDGRFGQESSRTLFRPAPVKAITRADCDAVAQAAFDDQELSQPVLDAIWLVCGGSIRVLAEGLIPALRDYGRGQPLAASLVTQVAHEILGIKPGKKS